MTTSYLDKIRELEAKLMIAEAKSRHLHEDLQRSTQRYEQGMQVLRRSHDEEVARLKKNHAEELMLIQSRNQQLLNDIINKFCSSPASAPNTTGMVTQAPADAQTLDGTAVEGDTVSTSIEALSKNHRQVVLAEILADADAFSEAKSLRVPNDPLAKLSEPPAPSTDLLEAQATLGQMQKVVPKWTGNQLEGKEQWSRDDQILADIEEREAEEKGADLKNGETFGDSEGEISTKTSLSASDASQADGVIQQFKARRFLMEFFGVEFDSLDAGITALRALDQGDQRLNDCQQRFSNVFQMPGQLMISHFEEMNRLASRAKHPSNAPCEPEFAYPEKRISNHVSGGVKGKGKGGFKTMMCTFFQAGTCTKGGACSYAHGEWELTGGCPYKVAGNTTGDGRAHLINDVLSFLQERGGQARMGEFGNTPSINHRVKASGGWAEFAAKHKDILQIQKVPSGDSWVILCQGQDSPSAFSSATSAWPREALNLHGSASAGRAKPSSRKNARMHRRPQDLLEKKWRARHA